MSFPLIVAHRGYSARAPENTLASLCLALDAGAPLCEIDVRRTADGEVVVLHDATVDRTTNGSGTVAEMTAEAVQALDAGAWKGPEFAGERIPLLSEALDVMRGRGHLVVEIKDEGIEQAVADVFRAADALRRVTVIAFSLEVCRRMRQVLPQVGVLWLVGGEGGPVEELADTALEAGVQGLDVFHGLVDEDFAHTVLRRGLSLWVWTVNEPARAQELAALGVGAITTDDPVTIAQALN